MGQSNRPRSDSRVFNWPFLLLQPRTATAPRRVKALTNPGTPSHKSAQGCPLIPVPAWRWCCTSAATSTSAHLSSFLLSLPAVLPSDPVRYSNFCSAFSILNYHCMSKPISGSHSCENRSGGLRMQRTMTTPSPAFRAGVLDP